MFYVNDPWAKLVLVPGDWASVPYFGNRCPAPTLTWKSAQVLLSLTGKAGLSEFPHVLWELGLLKQSYHS